MSLLTSAAFAKPWAKLAPAPLASDSAYTALSTRPAEGVSGTEASWLAVQRDWRAQRDGEDPHLVPSSITSSARSSGRRHVKRSGDAKFAKLASRPPGDLTDAELGWLVAESAAQRDSRDAANTGETRAVVGIGLVGIVAAFVGGSVLAIDAIFGK